MKKLFTLFAVAVMAFAANAATLTVAEGTTTNGHVPMYGLYCDTQGTISQVIYPADMLTDMVGKQITEIKFYASSEISPNLEGCLMNFALKIVEENEFAASAVYEIAEGDIYGTVSPAVGETEFVLTLNQPFTYEGGNLLISTEVIETSGWKGTYFYGIETGLYGACYQYSTSYSPSVCYREAFLPMTTFTYEDGQVTPPEPTEKTGAPTFNGYTTDGIHAYFVELVETEPSVIYYRVQYGHDGEFTEWAEYEDILSFTEDGWYRVEAYAVAPGKLESDPIAYEFVVSPVTGLSELLNGKTVANVRYFNMAGQEMQEANGMTIVVTTYTDGTTNSVKVMK